jgi:hypothetical protein
VSLLDYPQTIELVDGEAHLLGLAVGHVWRAANEAKSAEPPLPLDLGLLLALPVLKRLGKRLWRLKDAEEAAARLGKVRRKPRAFRLSCEEVGVVMRHVWPHSTMFTAGVLGKVQQKSLNLTPFVNF